MLMMSYSMAAFRMLSTVPKYSLALSTMVRIYQLQLPFLLTPLNLVLLLRSSMVKAGSESDNPFGQLRMINLDELRSSLSKRNLYSSFLDSLYPLKNDASWIESLPSSSWLL